MVFFAALMLWAFPYTDYRRPAGEPATKLWRPLWDRCVLFLQLDVALTETSQYQLLYPPYF